MPEGFGDAVITASDAEKRQLAQAHEEDFRDEIGEMHESMLQASESFREDAFTLTTG